jgi:uncharacterized protein (DUF2062 family)
MHWIKARLSSLYDKIVRERKSAEFIARGWSIGVFVGSVIPFGVQIYVALPLSFLLKGSKIGALTGTLISNPLTIFFLYPAQCWAGSRILGKNVSWEAITEAMKDVMTHQDWSSLSHLSGHLVTSFFAGGLMLAAVSTPLAYFGILYLVRHYRRVRGIPDVRE